MALNIEFQDQIKRVRVTPAMTMFEVVEAARDAFGLDVGSTQYSLTHRGRAVDLSIPFRLTGLVNNASLELVPVAAGDVPRVRVGVQVPEGKRVVDSFANDATLQQILRALKLLPDTGGEEFSLNYMQREVAFDAFESTTLKDLGIVSGSAMFRVQRSGGVAVAPRTVTFPPSPAVPTPAQAQMPVVGIAIRSSPGTQVPIDTRAEAKSSIPQTEDALPPAPMTVPCAPSDDVEMVQATPVAVQQPAPIRSAPQLSTYDALQLLRDSCFDAVSRTAVTTLMKIVANVLSFPENDKMRAIRLSNAAFHRNVAQHQGGVEFLLSLGFVRDSETEVLSLSSSDLDKTALEKALRLLNNECDDLSIGEAERPTVVVPLPVDETFNAYKSQITRMQMQPRGPSATEVLVDSLKAKQEELMQSVEIPARNTTISFPGESLVAPVALLAQEVEQTDPSERSDASLVIASMKARRIEMEKAQNFRTQAMRDLDELKRKKVFQSALIRIQFPDRVTLQAAFHPTETVEDVIAHVRECLSPSLTADSSFYLYVSPPMQTLAPEKTLSELSLVPAAHAYLTWINAPSPPATPSQLNGWYLRQDLIMSDEAVSKSRHAGAETAYPKPIALDEAAAAAAAAAAQATRKAAADAAVKRAGTESVKAKSGKKPGWLKL